MLASSFLTYRLNEELFKGLGDVSELMRRQSIMNLEAFDRKGWVRLMDGDPRAILLGFERSEGSRLLEMRHKLGVLRLMMKCLSKDQKRRLKANFKAVKKVVDMKWAYRELSGNFYYVKMLAVDSGLRGSGAFRRLMEPLFEECDRKGIPIVLETHDERNVAIYEHFGFRTVRTLGPGPTGLKQHCMVRDSARPE